MVWNGHEKQRTTSSTKPWLVYFRLFNNICVLQEVQPLIILSDAMLRTGPSNDNDRMLSTALLFLFSLSMLNTLTIWWWLGMLDSWKNELKAVCGKRERKRWGWDGGSGVTTWMGRGTLVWKRRSLLPPPCHGSVGSSTRWSKRGFLNLHTQSVQESSNWYSMIHSELQKNVRLKNTQTNTWTNQFCSPRQASLLPPVFM